MNLYGILATTSSSSTIGSNKAVDEVLNHDRYEGAIESITKLVNVVDSFSTMFVTAVAFLIISAAIWRNVLAGAYAAFPKFWDQVYEAHQEVKDVSWWQRLTGIKTSYQNWNMSTIKRFIMRLLPDIKVLTDFEDETLEPKTYFTKALVQMIAVVMIGVFIYNGYYRDTTVVVARFASELFERTIMSVDPIEVYDRIMATTGTPDFSTDNALTTAEKRKNEIEHKAYQKLISKYTDIQTANDKSELAGHIESEMESWCSQMSECIGSDGWKMSTDFMFTANQTKMAHTASEDGLTQSWVYSQPVSVFEMNTTKHTTETWYLTGVVTFTKVTTATPALEYQDLTMTAQATVLGNDWVLNVPSDKGSLKAYSGTAIVVNGTKYPFTYSDGHITFTGGSVPHGTNGAVQVSGSFTYKCGTKTHTIKYLNVSIVGGNPTEPSFSTQTIGGDYSFTFGQEIKLSDEQASNAKSEEN